MLLQQKARYAMMTPYRGSGRRIERSANAVESAAVAPCRHTFSAVAAARAVGRSAAVLMLTHFDGEEQMEEEIGRYSMSRIEIRMMNSSCLPARASAAGAADGRSPPARGSGSRPARCRHRPLQFLQREGGSHADEQEGARHGERAGGAGAAPPPTCRRAPTGRPRQHAAERARARL